VVILPGTQTDFLGPEAHAKAIQSLPHCIDPKLALLHMHGRERRDCGHSSILMGQSISAL
jgi:hypothetical protein